jgi:transmembrane sensor
MERFNTLLQRYFHMTASEQEVAEFLELLREPANEQSFKKFLDEELAQDRSLLFGQEERLKTLGNIFSGKSNRRNPFLVWMAAASLIMAAAAGIWWYSDYARTPPLADQVGTTVTLYGKDYVHLPDGSVVTLKEGSTLTYTRVYGADTREVTLTGEAYFDVAHNPLTPFKVRTGKIVTTVIGTAFNIKVTVGDKITVTVSRGKVAVGDENRIYDTIIPNEQLAVNTQTNEFVKMHIDPKSVTQWKNEYFILDKVTIAEAAELIGKQFNVKVTVANSALNGCIINAWFLNNETLEEVMDAVSAVRQAKYEIVNGTVTLDEGKGCDK